MSKPLNSKALPPFHLIIPAAGSASRMGMDVPKPYLKVNGKAVLRHTIEKFINFKALKSISVAINEENIDLFNDTVQGLDMVRHVSGGSSRKISVYNALFGISNVSDDDIVLIHDAARPMVQPQDIESLLETMKTAQAATLATAVTDTLLRDGEALDRDGIWSVQTPQAFKFSALKAVHEQFQDDDSFTDDAGLMRAAGHEVEVVPSSRQNIKITTRGDLKMVENMMGSNTETRTASGYDVHAFEKEPSDRKLILGGVPIEHDLALIGHSDADAVLHAITDALLGTINAGDIGVHFPPSDPQWKNVDSAVFLKYAMEMVKTQNGIINFIDVTILAEAPKISPHREAMQKRIADIMNISESRISIKATTTEKLGFTGRKEGIACQALATVQLPVTD